MKMQRITPITKWIIGAALLALSVFQASAQWVTQTFQLNPGWNAVYLHVDASHVTLDDLVGNDLANPIQEIWMWNPAPGTAQFVAIPQVPADSTSQWITWKRSGAAGLTSLIPNNAYLVYIPSTGSAYTWNVKGKPVPPKYQWTSSGLNFIGFPTRPVSPPFWDNFLAQAPDLQHTAEIFNYPGGELGPSNPVQIFALRSQPVTRGQAYWIRSPIFNHYFGPFEVVFTGSSGARFGDSLGQISFRIRNNAAQDITVSLASAASEVPPTGQTAIQGDVPVLVRGGINTSTLTFTYSSLSSGPKQWTLKKSGSTGSEIEVVIGVDRQQLTAAPGSLYASILRFTDSLNFSQIDVPVSAQVGSTAGLWVGSATVSSVNQYLNTYAKAADTNELAGALARLGLGEGVDGYHYEIDPATQRILVFGGASNKTGSYLLDGPAKLDPGAVARPFPLRLIIHNDGSTSRLLQRAYYGIGLATNTVVATTEDLLLPAQLASARRISAVHLPFSAANLPWDFTGAMQAGSNLTTTVDLSYDDQASNPFLHTYHPDHDNLDAQFKTVQSQGVESYEVRREITLDFTAPPADFDSLTRGGATLNGNYSEIITLLGKPGAQRQFTVRGGFTLNRISDITTLTMH
jgi:hypothetical protein